MVVSGDYDFCNQVLEASHIMGHEHLSQADTTWQVQKICHWNQIKEDVQHYINNCSECNWLEKPDTSELNKVAAYYRLEAYLSDFEWDKKNSDLNFRDRTLIPETDKDFQQDLIILFHGNRYEKTHRNKETTIEDITKTGYYWPGIEYNVGKHIFFCPTCNGTLEDEDNIEEID